MDTTSQVAGRRRRIEETNDGNKAGSGPAGSPMTKHLPKRDVGPSGTVPALGVGEPAAMTVDKLHEIVINMQTVNGKRYDLIHDTINAHAVEMDSRPRRPASRAEIDGVRAASTRSRAIQRLSASTST